MIFQLLGLFFRDPVAFAVIFPVLALSLLVSLIAGITIHEFSHAWVADRLGDPTPRFLKRLSLNPLAHLDPLGTLMLLFVGFGWGRPVPVNPLNFRTLPPRVGMALVALAGPVSNVVLAGLLGLVIRERLLPWHPPGYVLTFWRLWDLFDVWDPRFVLAEVVGYTIVINLALAVFNLLPLPPLDGYRILVGILPRGLATAVARLEFTWGPALLIMILALDVFLHTGIIGRLVGPALQVATEVVVGRRLT